VVSVVASDLLRARAVKDKLTERLRAEPDVNGVGLMRRADGWAIKVNLIRPAPNLDLPVEIDGVEIHTDVTGPIVAQ
jgi:hypothetical protein